MDIGPDILKCYQALGVQAGVPFDEIKRAYRDQIKLWHPDRHDLSSGSRAQAEEKCKQLNIAFRKLKLFYVTYRGEPIGEILAPGTYEFLVCGLEWGPNRTATDCEFRIQLQTTTDLLSTAGKRLPSGRLLIDLIPDVVCHFGPDDTKRSVQANLKMGRFSEACLGRAQRIAHPYGRYIGQTVLARVILKKMSFREFNEIETYFKADSRSRH